MLIPFISLIGLLVPTSLLFAPLPLPPDDGQCIARAVVLRGVDENDQDAPTACVKLHVLPAGACATKIVYKIGDDEKAVMHRPPKVWIGVRITAVPAPLAAHIGQGGMMIANVYKDSPADESGLQQYDVVIGLDGQELEGPEDLTAALAETDAGQAVKLTIVRKADKQKVVVRPAKRSADMKLTLKYDEPDDVLFESGTGIRGKALQLGPGGNWIIKDLGALHDIPDMLKELEKFNVHLDADDLPGMPHDLHGIFGDDMDVKILRDLDDDFVWHTDDDHGQKQVQITITVEDDGSTLTIQSDTDGKIHVTRTDADGDEHTVVYDSEEQFEEDDPEGFEVYQRHCVSPHSSAWISVHPSGDKLLRLRKGFQIDVQKKVREALERARKAHQDAGRGHKRALKKSHEALKKSRIEVYSGDDHEGVAKVDALMIFQDDNGIRIKISEDGDTRVYRFDSKRELKETEPDLYQRVKEMLE